MSELPKIHHFKTDPFNWYVVEDAGRITLVDAGFPGHFGVFEQGLRSIGRSVSDVVSILLTHAHADHMGFADRVSRASKAPVWIHRDDAVAAQRILELPWVALLSNAWRPFTAGMLTHAAVNRVFSSARIANPQQLDDENVLDVPGMPHVIHVPGHTAGEVAFYFPSVKTLISGDTLVTRDLFTGRHVMPRLVRRPLNDNYIQANQSLDRLLELGHVTLLPGHGDPWVGDMYDAVTHARENAEIR